MAASNKKKINKFDPKKVFTIISATREEIAEKLNDTMKCEGWDTNHTHFAPDDPRLTDEVCQNIIIAMQTAYSETDETQEIEYSYVKESLKKLLGIKIKTKKGKAAIYAASIAPWIK